MDSILTKLDHLYNKEGLNENNREEVVKILQSSDIGDLVHKIIYDGYEISDDDLLTLIKCAQYVDQYETSETAISDTNYDILYDMLESRMIGSPAPITVQGTSTKNKAYHKYTSLRGTLDKIYDLSITDDSINKGNKSRKGLYTWIKGAEARIKKNTGSIVNIKDADAYGFPKFDGVSVVFEFTKDGELIRALTRGFTETNECQDITYVFKGWKIEGPFTNADKAYGVKTEIMVSEEDLIKYNEKYHTNFKNSRSIITSIIGSDEVDEVKRNMLQIIPLRYSFLDENGNESLQELAPSALDKYPYVRCKLSDTDILTDFANNHKYVKSPAGDTLRCDGMVIYIIDKYLQSALGREDNKQKFEVAFKFTEEYAYSEVKDVIFTSGLFGRITPIAKIEPVKLKGNKVKEASLGSYGRFKSLHLCKGDTAKIGYDIIPYLYMDDSIDPQIKRNGGKLLEPPLVCPCCGKELEESTSGELLYCKNKDCDINRKGKILNYIQKMYIANISYATVNDFYEAGYLTSIKDLYKLQKYKHELCKLDGYGKKSVQAIIDDIDNHKVVEASQLLGSIGIEGIAKKKFASILLYYSFDELLEICENGLVSKLIQVPGIKDKTANKVIDGICENLKLLEFLENELTIIKENPQQESYKFKAYMTKVRDSNLNDYIKEKGGLVADSFTKEVTLLIVPDMNTDSKKVDKAKAWGIPIIPIADAKKYIEEHY